MIADLKPYPAMKDSGVEWLGKVPEHWDLPRTKTVLRERSEKGYPDEPLLAATQTKGVVRKDQYENRTVVAMKDLHLLKLVEVDDFVISLRSFQGGIESARVRGIISPAYTVLYPADSPLQGYLAKLFKSSPYIENLGLYVTGIRQGQNIDYEKLSRSRLPLPPLPEQAAIVRYLDHVDRRVRRLVRAKRKLIALLTEQKQAIIHRAVTRGLDPDVPLKDSGVEWLGKVPEHWEVRRLKDTVVGCINGVWGSDPNGPDDLPCVRVADFDRGRLRVKHPIPTLRAISQSERQRRTLSGGDLLLEKSGGGEQQPVGVVVLFDHEVAAVCSNFVARMPVREGHSPVFLTYLHSTLYAKGLNRRSIKQTTGIQNLDSSAYLSESAGLPPLPEQAAIVDYLDQATADIDTTITRAEREIELLNEYRTRLIADVVTGKLDVRDAAAALPEVDPLAEDDDADDLDADLTLDADELYEAPEEVEA